MNCVAITEYRTRNGDTMRPTRFSADTIMALLRKQTVASLPDVMAALGPRVSRRTAFRKLKDLHARTSYSHRGGYYTLDELADFDERGLWSFAGVRFSRAGTLVVTAEVFVNHAEAGHFVDELDNLLHVGTQDGPAQARRRRAADAAQARRSRSVGKADDPVLSPRRRYLAGLPCAPAGMSGRPEGALFATAASQSSMR